MAIRKSPQQTRKDLNKKIDKAGQYWIEKFPARLGNYSHVVAVPGKPGMVYARLETSGQVVEAVNWLAPGIFDFPVFVGRDKSQPSVLKVSEIRWIYALGSMINYIAFHHEQHEYPNADTVFVRRDQFMPLLVLPSGGFTARLFGDVIYSFGMAHPIRVDDADLNLSSYAVTAGAQYVLLEVLPDGTLNYVVGDLAGSRAALEAGPLPTPSDNAFPICAFEFFETQTELRRDSTERTIIDLRMFTSDTSSGAGTQIDDAPAETTIADGDEFGFWDISASLLKKITWTNIKVVLKTYFDSLYAVLAHTHTGTTDSPKLAQANTHQSPDTDSATSSLHHTIGASSTQAAAGNHNHFDDAEGDPADVAASAADGTSSKDARRDHAHKGVHSIAKSGDTALYGDVTLSEGLGILITRSGQNLEIKFNSATSVIYEPLTNGDPSSPELIFDDAGDVIMVPT